MRGLFGERLERNLMRAEGAFDLDAIDHLGAGPAFGRNHHDDGPGGTLAESILARVFLDRADFENHGFERGGHGLMHRLRLMAFDVVGAIAAAVRNCVNSSRGMRASTVGPAIL